MPENWFSKWVYGFILAIPMYLAKVPEPVAILLGMMAVDVVLSCVDKWLKEVFKPKLMFQGIVLRSMAFPVLWACHLADRGMGLRFDVETYIAYAMTGYTFIAIMERYIAIGGSGAPWMQEILDRVKAVMQTKQAEVQAKAQSMIVTDKLETAVAAPDGTVHTQILETSKVVPRDTIIKP